MKEDTNTEFKMKLTTDIEKEIIAFLNAKGGAIWIGINDSGEKIGVQGDVDEIQEKLANRIKTNIMPQTTGLIEIRLVKEDVSLIKVIVASGNQKPYHLTDKGMTTNGSFIRVGTTAVSMTLEQINNMYSKRTKFDIKKIKSPSQKLTFSTLKLYYEGKNIKFSNNLENYYGFLTEEGEYNYLAYLLADKNNISIKVAKYFGVNHSDLIEVEEYGGQSLVKTADMVLGKMKLLNVNKVKFVDGKRVDTTLIDESALREAVMNAFIHTSWEYERPPLFEFFSDRVVISSTGGLPLNYSEEEFFEGFPAPKCPELLKIFKDLGYIEHLGTGIPKILEAYDRSVFKFYSNSLRVSFPIGQKTEPSISSYPELTNRQKEIISMIKEDETITQENLALALGVSVATIKREFSSLIKGNYIERVGGKKQGSWIIYK